MENISFSIQKYVVSYVCVNIYVYIYIYMISEYIIYVLDCCNIYVLDCEKSMHQFSEESSNDVM